MAETAVTETRAPALTFPPEEAGALRAAYERADRILEYGSGGSTVLAAGMPGKRVWSVESDPDWLAGLEAWFGAHPPAAEVHLHHADIGPVGRWGAPQGNSAWARYHAYPLSVWDRAEFEAPDVVLIDGRFRAACLLTVLFRTEREVEVLFDDWADRPEYHDVTRWAEPVETIGRMARFEIAPRRIEGSELTAIMQVFTRRR